MSDLFFNIGDQVKLFNEFVSKGVDMLIASMSMIYGNIRKDWEQIEPHGKYAKQRATVKGSQSHGARSDASYPESQTSTPEEMLVYIKRAQMFSMGFDGLSLEAAAKGGAALKPEDFEQEALFIGISDDLSRQLVMDGSGRLCQVKTGGSLQEHPVKSPYFAEATKFIRDDRHLESYDATSGAGNIGQVLQVMSATVIKLTEAVDLTIDDYLFNEKAHADSEGAGLGETMGLTGIISDADPPYPNAALGLQGVKVVDVPVWKANVLEHGGVKRPVVDDLFYQACKKAERFGKVDVILVAEDVYRAYAANQLSYKSLPNQTEFWGGFSGLVFIYKGRRIPVLDDPYIPDGFAFFISSNNLVIHVLNPNVVTWERGVHGILKQVEGYNRYKAEGHIFMNLGVKNRRAFTVVKDLQGITDN